MPTTQKPTADQKTSATTAKYRRLADKAAKELAPYDRQLQKDVARLLVSHYKMIEAIIHPGGL